MVIGPKLGSKYSLLFSYQIKKKKSFWIEIEAKLDLKEARVVTE